MKKAFLKLAGALAVAAGLLSAPQASAAITGGLSFTGFLQTLDNADYTLATSVTSWGSPIVYGGGTGSFTGLSGTTTLNAPLQFDPFAAQSGPLWSIGSFSYTLSGISSIARPNSNELGLVGTGTVTDGTDTSPMSFIATFNKQTGTASWSFSQQAVPEGGSAVALLGLSLVGIAGVRRLKGAKA